MAANSQSFGEASVWRALAETQPRLETVELHAGPLGPSERHALVRALVRDGTCLYAYTDSVSQAQIMSFAQTLGLRTLDQTLTASPDTLTTIGASTDARKSNYVPYSPRPLGWHTDGYYNEPGAEVRVFLLHCVQPASEGGYNQFVDPRRVFARVAASNADYVEILSASNCLTIPANISDGRTLRAEISVPVFALADDTTLLTRYTERKHNAIWSQAALDSGAWQALHDAIRAEAETAPEVRLEQGSGVLSLNAIHRRSAFALEDDKPRTLWRGRFLETVEGTVSSDPRTR